MYKKQENKRKKGLGQMTNVDTVINLGTGKIVALSIGKDLVEEDIDRDVDLTHLQVLLQVTVIEGKSRFI